MANVFREREAAAWTQAGYTLGGMLKARQYSKQYEEFLDNDYEEFKGKLNELNARRAAVDTSKETDEHANIMNEVKVVMNDFALQANKNYPGNPKVNQAIERTFNTLTGTIGSFDTAEQSAAEQRQAQAALEATQAGTTKVGAETAGVRAGTARTIQTTETERLAAPGKRELTAAEADLRRAQAAEARAKVKGGVITKSLTNAEIAHNKAVRSSRGSVMGIIETTGVEGLVKQITSADELGIGTNPDFSPTMRSTALKALQPYKGVDDPDHMKLVRKLSGVYHKATDPIAKDVGGWALADPDDLKPGHYYELKIGPTVAVFMWDGESWDAPEEQ